MMIRNATAWMLSAAMAIAVLGAPASAAVTTSGDAPVTTAERSTGADGIRLAHGRHSYCAWGPHRGWWHAHGYYGRPYACRRPVYRPPAYQPRCFYDRWGRWVCQGY